MSACASLPRKNLVIAVRICILSLAGALLLAVAPAAAVAKPGCGGSAPVPGGSEIDQYAQSIPGACGNQENGTPPSGGGGSTGGGGGGGGSAGTGSPAASPISSSTQQRLKDLGAAGPATQALAEANAPRIKANDKGGSGGSSGGGSKAGTAIDTLLGSDSSGSGMGIALPLILLAIAACGVLYIVRRR